MGQEARSKAKELEERLTAAFAAVTECAVLAQGEATTLQECLPQLRMPSQLRDAVGAWAAALDQDAVGAVRVLQDLRPAAASGALNPADVLRVLTEIDARLMSALSRFADLSSMIEKAAEGDRRCESAYVDIIERTARLMRGFAPAQAATRALRDALGRAAGA